MYRGMSLRGKGQSSEPILCAAGMVWLKAPSISVAALIIASRASLMPLAKDRSTATNTKRITIIQHNKE